jgi:transposase-like protein
VSYERLTSNPRLKGRARRPFTSLARRAPELAKQRLLAALEASSGNVRAAARIIGMTQHPVWRWIVRWELHAQLHAIREKSGWWQDGSPRAPQFKRLRA